MMDTELKKLIELTNNESVFGVSRVGKQSQNAKSTASYAHHHIHPGGKWKPDENCVLHALKLTVPTKGGASIKFVQQIDHAGFKHGHPIHYDTFVIRKTKKYLDRHEPLFEDKLK